MFTSGKGQWRGASCCGMSSGAEVLVCCLCDPGGSIALLRAPVFSQETALVHTGSVWFCEGTTGVLVSSFSLSSSGQGPFEKNDQLVNSQDSIRINSRKGRYCLLAQEQEKIDKCGFISSKEIKRKGEREEGREETEDRRKEGERKDKKEIEEKIEKAVVMLENLKPVEGQGQWASE